MASKFLTIFLFASLLLASLVSAKPTQRPKYTLDPETLAEVKNLIKATPAPAKPSRKVSDIEFRLGAEQEEQTIILFEDADQISLASTHIQPKGNSAQGSLSAAAATTGTSNNKLDHKCSNPRERYHLLSGKCYAPGSIGPCSGANMLFYAAEDDKIYGNCDCDYEAEIPLVYHTNTSQCYPIYHQAYCKENEWLVFENPEDPKPVCEPRRCEVDPLQENIQVFFNGNCAELNQGDACENRSEKVIFLPDGLQPVCAESPASEFSNFNVPKLKCKPGSSEDIRGNCRQKIKFNFNG